MCLVLPLCGIFGILKNKNKKVWRLYHCKSCIVVLSIYIRTLFYFKVEKNKKERQGNKKNNRLIPRKMIIVGFELTIPDSGGQCANHCATKDLKLRMYLSYLFIMNLNTDKTVSMQSELLAFLPTLYTRKEFQQVSRPQLSERVSSLTRRSLSVKIVDEIFK